MIALGLADLIDSAVRASIRSDGVEVAQLDEASHATVVRAAGNPELARLHGDITERIRIIRRLDFTQRERVEQRREQRPVQIVHADDRGGKGVRQL